MGLTTIAEGVETENQFNSLKEMACDIIQGYLMGKPQSVENIIELVKNHLYGENDRKTGV